MKQSFDRKVVEKFGSKIKVKMKTHPSKGQSVAHKFPVICRVFLLPPLSKQSAL